MWCLSRCLLVVFVFSFFFFFKQKTAYEMRISDWSSDVCSSDLGAAPLQGCRGRPALPRRGSAKRNPGGVRAAGVLLCGEGPRHSVTPDLFRGPMGGKRRCGGSSVASAANWTPEQVRGDD